MKTIYKRIIIMIVGLFSASLLPYLATIILMGNLIDAPIFLKWLFGCLILILLIFVLTPTVFVFIKLFNWVGNSVNDMDFSDYIVYISDFIHKIGETLNKESE